MLLRFAEKFIFGPFWEKIFFRFFSKLFSFLRIEYLGEHYLTIREIPV